MEIEVPRWILKAFFQPHGRRLPRLPEPERYPTSNYRSNYQRIDTPHVESTVHGCQPRSWVVGPNGNVIPLPQNAYESNYSPSGGYGTATLPGFSGFEYKDHVQFYCMPPGGVNPPLEWSMCRVCKTVCWGRQGRNIHRQVSPNCMKYLFKTIHRLKRDQKCVVCNKPCLETAHLVYLCGSACKDIWKHRENTGRMNLTIALRLEDCPEELLEDDIEWGMYGV